MAQEAPAPAQAAAAPSVDDEETWKQFTPAEINPDNCMARTWAGGKGGQCNRPKVEGQDFCGMHSTEDKYKVHGRVDGPIPAKKLAEFLQVSGKPVLSEEEQAAKKAAREAKAPTSAATPPPKKRDRDQAENSTATPEEPQLKKPSGGAFGIFLSENRQAIKDSLPDKHGRKNSLGDTMTEASVRWKALPEDEKKVYQDQYEAMTAEYKAAPRKKKMKKEKEVLLTPDGEKLKRPCFGAFGVYMEENRAAIKASLPADHKMCDVAKQVGVLWKALAEDEKKDFKAKSEDKMATYKDAASIAKDAAKASKALVLQAARSDAESAAPVPQQKLGKFVRSKLRRKPKRAW